MNTKHIRNCLKLYVNLTCLDDVCSSMHFQLVVSQIRLKDSKIHTVLVSVMKGQVLTLELGYKEYEYE